MRHMALSVCDIWRKNRYPPMLHQHLSPADNIMADGCTNITRQVFLSFGSHRIVCCAAIAAWCLVENGIEADCKPSGYICRSPCNLEIDTCLDQSAAGVVSA